MRRFPEIPAALAREGWMKSKATPFVLKSKIESSIKQYCVVHPLLLVFKTYDVQQSSTLEKLNLQPFHLAYCRSDIQS
jgi:hypothetical protein